MTDLEHMELIFRRVRARREEASKEGKNFSPLNVDIQDLLGELAAELATVAKVERAK